MGVQTCQGCYAEAVAHWQKALHRRSEMDDTPVGHARLAYLEELNQPRPVRGMPQRGVNEPGGYCKTDDVGI